MSRKENINRQRQLIGVAMAAVMILFMAVVVIAGSTEKTYASGAIIERVDITVAPVKCGTNVTVDGDVFDQGNDYLTQTPALQVTVNTPHVSIAAVKESYPVDNQAWFLKTAYPHLIHLKKADLFEGEIKGDSEVWVRIPIDPDKEGGYYFDEGDWISDDPNWDYGYYATSTKVYVNGKEATLMIPSSPPSAFAIAKLDTANLEHDWDGGKETTPPTATQPGVKTYTCKGCGATKTEAIPAKGGSDGLPMAKMTAKGKKGLNISWTKVDNADGYDIYLSKCNWKDDKYTPKQVKTIMGNSTFKWTKKKGLKKKTAYKSYVRAFVMKDGTKTYVSKTPIVHAYTSGGDRTYTNPKSVKVNSASVTLSAGQTSPIKATVKKVKSGKKLIKKNHAPKLRYYSDNEKVAKASGGTIQAVSAGTCNVYAMAANGVRATIIVTVK